MKIFLETKDANHHRIVFVGKNGKLTYSGEFVRRKGDAMATLYELLKWLKHDDPAQEMGGVIERPYKRNAFPRNAKSKAKK